MIYSLDTNIISYMLNDNDIINDRIGEMMRDGHTLTISPVVDYEIRRGLLAKNYLNKLRKFEQLEQFFNVGEFNLKIWRRAADIYASLSKQGQPLGRSFDGDYFIAAYCIINGYTLITNNKDHFGRIDGLRFENWQE
jgi:tRNA(fMet)-specific endonuclease VapC